MRSRHLLSIGLCFIALALPACPSSGPAPSTPATATSVGSTTTAPTTTSSATDTAPKTSSSAADAAPTPIGSSGVKSPVFSDDSCNKDAECAPVAMCHSNKCVALANVGTMKPGMLCTMDCRGGTVDCGFNHCGCAEAPGGGKRCALLAGPQP